MTAPLTDIPPTATAIPTTATVPAYTTELRALLKLGWPMIATQFFIMATGFLDTAMAGHYSATDLAGVAMGGSLLWPLFMLFTGITMALTPIVSQLRGAGRMAESGAVTRQGLWLCLLTSSLLVATLTQARFLLIAAGVVPEIAEIANDYLVAVSWGVPPVVIYVALRNTCEGLGHTLPPMIIAGSVLPLNAFLNYALIYGEFGFPELGGVGCGYATAVVFWAELLLMLFVVRRPFFRATGLWQRFEWPKLEQIQNILKVGVPIGLTVFLEMAVYAAISVLIGRISVNAVAAHSIAGNLNWLTYVIPMSLGSAASIRVGYFVGSRQFSSARQSAMTAFRFAIGYALVVSVLLVFGRVHLVSLYTTDLGVIETAATLMLFIAVYQIVDDTQAVAGGALRGYTDTRVPMLFGLVGYWAIALPVGSILAFGAYGAPVLGVYGYWTGMTLGLLIVAILMAIRLYNTSGNPQRIERLAAV